MIKVIYTIAITLQVPIIYHLAGGSFDRGFSLGVMYFLCLCVAAMSFITLCAYDDDKNNKV